MSLFLDSAIAFVAGVAVFLVAPISLRGLPWDVPDDAYILPEVIRESRIPLPGPLLPGLASFKRSVINQYLSLAMAFVGRGLLIKRAHGGWMLRHSTDNSELDNGGEVVRIGKARKIFRDPDDFMTTFQNRPFGIAHEKRSPIFDARIAVLARRFAELHQDGEWQVTAGNTTYFKTFFSLPKGETAIASANDALKVMPERAAPGLAERIDGIIEKAYELFNSDRRRMLQTVEWLTLLGGGVVIMFLAAKMAETLGGSGGGGGATLPFWMVVPIL